MNPVVLAGAAEALGTFVGGKRREKYAKRYRMEAQAAAEEAIRAVQREKQEVKDIRADDEKRLRDASGYDFKKLRDQAVAAGFNPLTVLAATGGAGYDGRGAVLTTPFVSSEGAYARGLQANLDSAQPVIQGAGYIGDSIAGGARAAFEQYNRGIEQSLDAERNKILAMDVAGRASSSGMSPFGSPVRTMDAAPKAYKGSTVGFGPDFIGPMPVVPVQTATGWINLPWNVAKAIGKEPGDAFIAQDWEDLQGDMLSEMTNIAHIASGAVGGDGYGGIMWGVPKPKAADPVRSPYEDAPVFNWGY